MKVTVIIPTIDESASLRETVRALISIGDVLEIILVTCEKTLPGTLTTCRELELGHKGRVFRVGQERQGLGDAFQTGIAYSEGSHIVTMFADLESDPRLVPRLVSEAKANPGSIISASRWLPDGGFRSYGRLKLVLNRVFQRVCEFIFRTGLSDFTYGYRIYPARVLTEIAWRETGHAFVIESILLPHFRKIPIREVPAVWTSRREGTRRFRYCQYARYFLTCARLYRHFRSRQMAVDSEERDEAKLLTGRRVRPVTSSD